MSRARAFFVVFLLAGLVALLLLPRRLADTDAPFAASGVAVRTYSESGQPAWELHAQEGELVGEDGALSHVEIRFLSSDEAALTATADRLVQAEGESTLAGRVAVERNDGLRLRTEKLIWSEDEETLRADAITLSHRDLYVEGGGFLYDLPSERAILSRGVLVEIDRQRPTTARGDRAEESNDVLVVEGNVRVETSEGTYRCERIEADDEFVRLVGNVEGKFDEGQLRADTAQMDAVGRVIATGSVTLHLNLSTAEVPDGA